MKRDHLQQQLHNFAPIHSGFKDCLLPLPNSTILRRGLFSTRRQERAHSVDRFAWQRIEL